MYKNEFDKQFSNNTLHNGYMFYGQNDFLVEEYSLKVAMFLANNEDITKIYFEEYSFDYCYDMLSSSSLFSSSNILLIKTSKKIAKKEVDKLLIACELNSASKVIFACLGEVDFKTMTKSFIKKTSSVEVRFFALYDNEAVTLLYEKAQNLGIKTDSNSLMYLYNMHQKNLALCVSDLSKLAILEEQITSKTINNHCFGLGNIIVEDFLIKLFTKQNINNDLYFLLEEGINEIQLLNRITAYVQQLFMINSYLKLNGVLNIKEIWGYNLPKNIAQTLSSIASKFKKDDYIYMMNYLQDLELELKTSKIIDINVYFQSKLRVFIQS
jgi:DNA polymerase-3 subunit delta